MTAYPCLNPLIMNRKLLPITRALTAISFIALFATIFLPLWRIELSAPQYPEGLVMKIYPDKLGGNVDVINGLNHYIGMRTLHAEDFFEFTILPWLIGAIAFFGLLTFIINRKWFFIAWTAFFILFGITAMFDFYRWEYNYGHNLDPAAAIRVPGMSYQPHLIGYKQLLNFGAYSIPAVGGWIFLGVGLVLIFGAFLELRNTITITRKLEIKTTAAAMLLLVLMSCQQGPVPIKAGIDGCDFCKMTISDLKFGGELLTKKGKLYKFDDLHCISSFYKSGYISPADFSGIWFEDFANPGNFIPENKSYLLKSNSFRSPMGGNIAAFANMADLEKFQKDYPGDQITWEQIIK